MGGEKGRWQQALSDVLYAEELFCETPVLWDPLLAGWGLVHHFLLIFLNPHPRICSLILEREEKGEREKYQRGRDTLTCDGLYVP